MTARVVLVGGGNMGAALLGGMIAGGWAPPEQLAVVEVLATRRTVLEGLFPGVAVRAAVADAPADGAVIAVDTAPPALNQHGPALRAAAALKDSA